MKIAVFLPNWIGDVVMATPALRALRRRYPDARIIGVLQQYVAAVLDGTNLLDEVIFHNKKGPRRQTWLAVARQLRQLQPDMAILLPNSFRAALVAWLGGCRRRIGYQRYGRGLLLTDRLRPERDGDGRLRPSPAIDAYNNLAGAAGCADMDHRMELATTKKDETQAEQVWRRFAFGKYKELVCLNPGGAFGAAKHWPAEHFARLARALVDRRCAGVLVLCGPNEIDEARAIVKLAQRDAVHTLADFPLSIGLTKACIRKCDLLVTTDSGPRHFAGAFDKPVASLFGPTHIDWTVTYHRKEVCLQKKVPCGPCQLRTCPLDHRCMMDLSPAEVYAAAVRLLDEFPSPRAVPNEHQDSLSEIREAS